MILTGYFSWINNAEFPLYTKKILKELVAEIKYKENLMTVSYENHLHR